MKTDFYLKNMLPPEEILPNGICESKCLQKDLGTRFARITGESMVFDYLRRLESDGQCVLSRNPHPHCHETCSLEKECDKLWSDHFGVACCSNSIIQWQCPDGNTVLIGSVYSDVQLLYFGKVVLSHVSDPKNIPLIRHVMHGMLREMALLIQNSILKNRLKASSEAVCNGDDGNSHQNKTDPECPAVSRAKEYINEHYRNTDLMLKDVANAVGISPCYLSTLFRSATGCTFLNYVANMRLSNAKKLMDHTNLPLSEVAWRSGFSSLRNLRRALKRADGRMESGLKEEDSS